MPYNVLFYGLNIYEFEKRMIMGNRSMEQILAEKLERLESKKEDRINRYILPIETQIEDVREKIKSLYLKKGIKTNKL